MSDSYNDLQNFLYAEHHDEEQQVNENQIVENQIEGNQQINNANMEIVEQANAYDYTEQQENGQVIGMSNADLKRQVLSEGFRYANILRKTENLDVRDNPLYSVK